MPMIVTILISFQYRRSLFNWNTNLIKMKLEYSYATLSKDIQNELNCQYWSVGFWYDIVVNMIFGQSKIKHRNILGKKSECIQSNRSIVFFLNRKQKSK